MDSSVSGQLDTIKDLRSSITLDDMLGSAQDALASLRNQSASFQESKVDMQKSAKDWVKFIEFMDGFRLAGMSVFLVIPLVIGLLGLCSCVCRCGCGAMVRVQCVLLSVRTCIH